MVEIRDATEADLPAILEIANALIPTTTYTWTEDLETLDARRAWFASRRAAGYPVLVAVLDGAVVGWGSYGNFRDIERTPGYRVTVEHSLHVRQGQWGRGIGRALVDALADRARQDGKRVMVAGIDSTNVDSIEFHARLGFVETARMPGVGELRGQRVDLVFMQRDIDLV